VALHQQTEAEPLVREALAALAAMDYDRYMALWADDGRLEFPMPLPGMPGVVEGKAQIGEVERRAFTGIARREIKDVQIHPFADPSLALVEFEIDQSFGEGAGGLKGRFAIVYGARDGKLVLMREYFDTRLMAEAFVAYEAAMAASG
jgi:uncharacterized protein